MAALRTPGTRLSLGPGADLRRPSRPTPSRRPTRSPTPSRRPTWRALKDELGDLLLQVVYHARMAEEQGAFAFADVVDAITAKMIRRHPHVFGTRGRARRRRRARASGSASRPRRRPQSSGRERRACRRRASLLDDVPVGLPALTRAVKLQDKAARVGFDWPSLAPGVRQAQGGARRAGAGARRAARTRHGASAPADRGGVRRPAVRGRQRRAAPAASIPEAALRAANHEIHPPLSAASRSCWPRDGRTPAQSTLAEMDRLWDQAKAEEREPYRPSLARRGLARAAAPARRA